MNEHLRGDWQWRQEQQPCVPIQIWLVSNWLSLINWKCLLEWPIVNVCEWEYSAHFDSISVICLCMQWKTFIKTLILSVAQSWEVWLAVEARTTAIRAIRDGHIASVTTQFQLLLLKFPAHIRKMPIKQFLAEHCPNTKAQTREDGSLQLDIIQDPDAAMEGFQGPGGSSNAINKEFDFRIQNTPGFGPHRSSTLSIPSSCFLA